MRLRLDAHIHLYPCYDLGAALHRLRTSLAAPGEETCCLALLAERSDCRFFAGWRQWAPSLPAVRVEEGENVLLLREAGYPDLYLVAGRQINTRERVEILALTTDALVPDGLAAQETVARVRAGGGVPVVNWAPGKWMFARRRVVETLLAQNQPGSLLVGDTSLRPRGWPMPRLMRQAVAMGFGLVAGSDPLPLPGEEQFMGSYGMEVAAPFAPADAVGSLRALLTTPALRPRLIGRRGGPVTTLLRLYRNARAARA